MGSLSSPRLRLLTGGFLILPALAAAAVVSRAQEPAAAPTLESVVGAIREESVRATLDVLAGPEMQGRGSFTPGFDRAADWVSDQLAAIGLEPLGVDGGYRLPYTLDCVRPDASKCSLYWEDARPEDLPALGSGYVPMLGSKTASASGEAVFAGYALQVKDEKWSDYKEREVKGKIVFAFMREPWADDPKSKRFEGVKPVYDARLVQRIQEVAAAGAIGFVYVPDPGLEADDDAAFLGAQIMPAGRGGSVQGVEARFGMPAIPVMSVSRRAAAAIFGADLRAYHAEIEKKKKSRLLKGVARVTMAAAFEYAPTPAYNLAARLRGTSDAAEGKREVLVLGAHLDHVGLGIQQEYGGAAVEPYPGADDNASGSTALLEVARALARVKPQVDVLFLWFSAEELGLLGSAAYCERPLYPHERTVAMLNMDQIARTDPKEFNVGGTWNDEAWAKFVQEQARRAKTKIKIDFKAGRDLYARSDQFSFFAKGVPALFFFEGDIEANPVYHKPGDVPETIAVGKMTEIARIFAACAYAIAMEGERLR